MKRQSIVDKKIALFEERFGELPDDSREAFKIAIEMDYEGGGLSKATMQDLVEIFGCGKGCYYPEHLLK